MLGRNAQKHRLKLAVVIAQVLAHVPVLAVLLRALNHNQSRYYLHYPASHDESFQELSLLEERQ